MKVGDFPFLVSLKMTLQKKRQGKEFLSHNGLEKTEEELPQQSFHDKTPLSRCYVM